MTTVKLFELAGIRDYITTEEAALVLNRKVQTLRKWSCEKNGPILPVRVFHRLLWSVQEIASLLQEGK